MGSIVSFSIDEVDEMREKWLKAYRIYTKSEGWSLYDGDLTKVFKIFPTLRLKPGYKLIAYLFREGGNGNGKVWAIPQDVIPPAPELCTDFDTNYHLHFLRPPKPGGALNVAEVLEGDGSPKSYLSASLLLREIQEFGAMWHGIIWGAHTIIGSDPWLKIDDKDESASSYDTLNLEEFIWGKSQRISSWISSEEGWQWIKGKPKDWSIMYINKGKIHQISFITHNSRGLEQLIRHYDVYKQNNYIYETKTVSLGFGPQFITY